MKHTRFTLAALLFAALAANVWAVDLPRPNPDIAEFARGVKFTVNGYTGTEVLTNFPVLVRLSDDSPTGFHYSDFTRADYKDLCFVDMQTNGLPCEVDTWNASGESLVWVTLPRVTNGTEFVMWYHSSSLGTTVCDNTAWGDYAGVWHMNDYGAGDGAVTISDATTNHLDATAQSESYAQASGRIGGARTPTKDGSAKSTQRIEVNLDSSNNPNYLAKRAVVNSVNTDADHAFTVSMWVKPVKYSSFDGPNSAYLMGRKTDDNKGFWGVQFHYDNGKKQSIKYNQIRVWRNETGGGDTCWHTDFADSVIPSTASSCYGNWYKLDVVYSGTTAYFYVNGGGAAGSCLTNTSNKVPANGTENKLFLTGTSVGNKGRPFRGDLDEFRLRAGAMSADWVKADYDTVDNASFLSAGSVETVKVKEMPFAGFSLLDSGAAFATFSSVITSLGDVEGGATSCDIYCKVWKSAESEPNEWTLLRSGVSNINVVFTNSVTGLTTGTAYSWKLYAENNLGDATEEIGSGSFTTSGAGVAGVGGETYRVKDDYVHRFTVDEDTTSYVFTPPSYVTTLRALIVAGGGPGGYDRGGGGGAGGLVYDEAFALPAGATYTINVGTGGVASASADAYGVNGGNSSIVGGSVNLVVYGGGAGGNAGDKKAGVDGGSGGGSAADKGAVGKAMNNSAQGHNGGQGINFTFYNAGGGGGAAELGGDAASAGATFGAGGGGSGFLTNISGENAYYAGGGGGGTAAPQSGKVNNIGRGGDGGGGDGGSSTAAATAGQDNLGGGGGGGHANCPGANGGSGVVILRYAVQGNGSTMPEPAVSLSSAAYDADTGVVSFAYRVAWAGYGYQVADVGIAWGYSPSALSTTNAVDSDTIGIGTGTIQLPNVSKTVYLRAVATNAGGYSAASTEQEVFKLFNPDAPVGTISNTVTGVTNAVFSVNVTDLGTDATNASVTVQVCESEYFSGTVLSFSASTVLEQTGSVSVSATGLETNTAYYARAIVVNSENEELTTDAIEFSTLQPDEPIGEASVADIGLTTLSALVHVTNFGTGSDSAMVRLEVSTDSDFSTLAGHSDEVPAILNEWVTITTSELTPDTTYYRRVRIRNWWNFDKYIDLSHTPTRKVPFSAVGPLWTVSGDKIDISLSVSAVYDGAECTAVLTYCGEEIGSHTFNAAGTVTWSSLAEKADGAVAQIVVTTTVGGTDYSRTFSAPVTPGAREIVVENVLEHASAANALWMRPGDVAELPEIIGATSYQVLNERFAKVEGSMLAALEPGIVGIRCVNADAVTNIMGVVILPEPIGSGKVYVYDETKINIDNNAYNWSNTNCWVNAADGSRVDCPTNGDDIAVVPFYTKTGNQFIRHRTDITLGGLYAGQICPDKDVTCVLERYKDDSTKTVTFRRSDGGTVNVKVCPNGEKNKTSVIQFGGYDINVTWEGNILIDGCSSETDVACCRGLVKYTGSAAITNTAAQGTTITVQGLPGYSVTDNNGTTKFHGTWKGEGEIVKKGQGSLVFPDDFSGFSVTVRELTGPNLGGLGEGTGGVLMRAAAASNATAHVYGFVATDNGVPKFNGRGRGYFATGNSSVGPEHGGQAPGKGLYMHGGSYFAKLISGAWGVDTVDEKLLDVLSIGSGMGFLRMDTPNNGNGQPINAVTAKTLAQTDKGTFFFYDPSVNNNAATTVTNNMFSIRDWATHAVGGSGYGEAGIEGAANTFKIVPWFVSAGDSSYNYLMFPAVDSNGRLVRPVRTCTYIDEAGSEDANATCWIEGNTGYGSLTHGTATDIVINSLFLNNSTRGDKYLGADRTLMIKSGGLIFQGNGSAIGLPGRDDNGSLILGDADHPAYVWNKAFGNYTNQIWAAVTAPGGFVSTYTGNLELGGNQTGIGDEIVVAAGCLALGNAEHGITLAANLPVRVCAGAKLILPSSNAIAKSPLKIDGSAEVFGKVELPVNQTCASLAVRDVFESTDWTTLPSGTYGSSESAAEFVRDDLFVGPGVLTVGEAKTRGVMFLIY